MNTQRKSTRRKSRRQNARSSTRLLDWPPRTAGLLEAAARVLAAEFGLFFGIEVPVRARQTCIARVHVISRVPIRNSEVFVRASQFRAGAALSARAERKRLLSMQAQRVLHTESHARFATSIRHAS